VIVGQEYTAPAQGFFPAGSGWRNGPASATGCFHSGIALLRLRSYNEF
jgi:hypothetical protein